MSLLSVTKLVKRYGGLLATDHCSLNVECGEIHALIGPNGAGKTTLLSQLAGELRSDQGTVMFDGHDVTAATVDRRARLGLARSYQITSVFQEFTALQNVMLAAQAHAGHSFRFWQSACKSSELRDPSVAVLERVGLGQRMDISVGAMSHGEHRQLELGMAMVGQPKLLLLDEPMAGMSQRESETMGALLAELKGQCAMVLVEHDMEAVFALADKITVLVYGKPIACGSADEIRQNADVRVAYLGDEQDFQFAPSS